VPFKTYEPDPNRLEWAPGANRLWYRIRMDMPISKRFADEVTTAAGKPSGSASPSPSQSPSAGATPSQGSSPSPSQAEAAAAAAARAQENGLCA
jgi:hypothetical protein